MKRTQEQDFARATILLGDYIAQQLIESARRSRARWTELFCTYGSDISELMSASRTRKVVNHPLVRGFMTEWAFKMQWGLRRPIYTDALCINVPQCHLEPLAETGRVGSFLFFIGDVGDFCSASLHNDDGHNGAMLIVNCPAWLHIASAIEWESVFERQLNSVIQHEMAHFRYRGSNSRSELHAHCRGIASVVPFSPSMSVHEFRTLVEQDYPEFVHNDETQRLIWDQSNAPWRLIRRWQRVFSETRCVA